MLVYVVFNHYVLTGGIEPHPEIRRGEEGGGKSDRMLIYTNLNPFFLYKNNSNNSHPQSLTTTKIKTHLKILLLLR